MKIKVPKIEKKNKDNAGDAQGGMMFDLTGGASAQESKGSVTESVASGKERGGASVKERIGSSGVSKILGRFSRKPAEDADPFSFSSESRKGSEMSFGADTFGAGSGNSFEVSVRNADPIIKRMEEASTVKAWTRDLQLNLATAAVIMAMLSLLMTAAEEPMLTLFCLPTLVVVMLLSTIESLDKGKIKLIAAAGIAILLIAAIIILRKYIGNGLALIMNQLYDTGEASQAYLYDRLPTGEMADAHPNRCMHMAALWLSSLLGLLAALPPIDYRRGIAIGAGVFSMLAFAYYGIIPMTACIAVLAAAILFVLARGSLISALPVFLIAAILFGAVVLFDPGESYGISRADENFRDRFAFKSSYLKENEEFSNGFTSLDDEYLEDENGRPIGGAEVVGEHRGLVITIAIFLVLAVVGIFVRNFRKKLRKRQLENRAGINSNDPKEAMTAMFPYTVRWLQPAGIEAAGKAFIDLVPMISSELSEEYADRFKGMYELWEEAAYSDHKMDEAGRDEMNTFMNDTINMVKDKGNFASYVRNTIKYAL